MRSHMTRRQMLVGAAAAAGVLLVGPRVYTGRKADAAGETSPWKPLHRLFDEPRDDDRGLDLRIPSGRPLRVQDVRNGMTVALETGGVWEGIYEFSGLKGVRFTAYGDRDKPLPLFRGAPTSFKLMRSQDCTIEFLDSTDSRGNCWQAFDSQDILFRGVVGRDSGRVRGMTPGSGNRGHAFSIRGKRAGKITLVSCEGYGMAEDGIQAGPDVKQAQVTVEDCYFHDNVEDGIDVKAGEFEILDCRLENNRSKALVMHGHAGRLRARRTSFSGSKLHDGVHIDGKRGALRKLREPLVFEDCVMSGNKAWGLIAKRIRADVVMRNTQFGLNGSGDWRSGVGHSGEVIVA